MLLRLLFTKSKYLYRFSIDFVWQFEERIKHYLKKIKSFIKYFFYQKILKTVVSKQRFFQIVKFKIFNVNLYEFFLNESEFGIILLPFRNFTPKAAEFCSQCFLFKKESRIFK